MTLPKFNCLAVRGAAGSGKDTVMDMVVKLAVARGLKVTKVALADPMKRFCQEIFRFSHDQLWGPSYSRNAPDTRYPRGQGVEAGNEYLTPRYALQTLGTEWGRNCYEHVWVDYFLRMNRWDSTRLVLVPDVRFPNEARALKDEGGRIWRVDRPGTGLAGAAGAHASESFADDPAMEALTDRVIANTGTLDDLREQVEYWFARESFEGAQ